MCVCRCVRVCERACTYVWISKGSLDQGGEFRCVVHTCMCVCVCGGGGGQEGEPLLW